MEDAGGRFFRNSWQSQEEDSKYDQSQIQINLSQNKKGRNKNREPQISGRAFHNDPGGVPPAASVVMGAEKIAAGRLRASSWEGPFPGVGVHSTSRKTLLSEVGTTKTLPQTLLRGAPWARLQVAREGAPGPKPVSPLPRGEEWPPLSKSMAPWAR